MPKGVMSVRTEEEAGEQEDSKENKVVQKLEDQEIEAVEEPVPQKIEFYKDQRNWVHSEQCKCLGGNN
jgi:hypothetical protein